ncbi:MAG: RNA polymerase sigma factor, partial [Planctomycetes bacterium]|nr:RNA polymerase sigma factor [Planctomycetota bacterium]
MDWVRDLARALLQGDAASIDDAVQDTWLAASKNPPPDSRALKPWLATILRRTIWRQRRSDRRRLERERRAARAEAIEPAADAVARATAQRDVVDAVLKLDEPYRSTLITRYFDGLGPAAIATRDGIPLETVRSRLQRGLAKLRESLDQQRGGANRARALLLLVVQSRAAVALVHASAWRNATRIAAGLLVFGGISVSLWSTLRTWLADHNTQISLPEIETRTADSDPSQSLA